MIKKLTKRILFLTCILGLGFLFNLVIQNFKADNVLSNSGMLSGAASKLNTNTTDLLTATSTYLTATSSAVWSNPVPIEDVFSASLTITATASTSDSIVNVDFFVSSKAGGNYAMVKSSTSTDWHFDIAGGNATGTNQWEIGTTTADTIVNIPIPYQVLKSSFLKIKFSPSDSNSKIYPEITFIQ